MNSELKINYAVNYVLYHILTSIDVKIRHRTIDLNRHCQNILKLYLYSVPSIPVLFTVVLCRRSLLYRTP